ncbi:MAG: protein translocase subunit SecD [Pirellulales bacterium]
MSTTGSCLSRAAKGCPRFSSWLLMLGIAVLLAGPVANSAAQDAAADSSKVAAPAETKAETPAAETSAAPAESTANETKSETPATDASATEPPAENAESAADTTKSAPATPETTPGADDKAAATRPGDSASAAVNETAKDIYSRPITYGLIIVGLFVLPVIVGNWLASWLRMPDHGWKISLVLGTLAASIAIVSMGEFKAGPDLAGGITLIYELNEPPAGEVDTGQQAKMQDLIDILKRRIDPTGTREVTIREYGSALEIIIPNTGQDALQFVKRRITEMGQLEFRITADPTQPNPQEREIIRLARDLSPAINEVKLGGRTVAEWVAYSPEEFGPADQEDPNGRHIVKRLVGDTPEALVLVDPESVSVTGKYLRSVAKSVDERGGPAVHFTFDSAGARRFQQLTSKNTPNQATGARRFLGIVLDKRLLSAPSIESTISSQGQISGRSMREEEVDYIVSILREGELPLRLAKEPISEQIISPTLGLTTVQAGTRAIAVSFAAIIIFMLIYYQFAGFVACIALGFNLLLVVALMVLMKAAFTLPGLAGLVLTIGMSVDANVLIFERMREELKGGAALRMVIRNGFDRAMSAIVDSNITTIISGIALYLFATDQVKGFAVTLILGILTSMYTAIFVSRLIFDIFERQGWIKKLTMLKLMATPNYNFLGVRYVAIGASLVLIGIGMVAVYARGWNMLDIDFTGGSSVTFALIPEDKMSIAQVRDSLEGTALETKNLLVVERGNSGTRFSIDTSEQSVDSVKQIILDTFDDKLLMYSVDTGPLAPFKEGDFSGFESQISINKGPAYEADEGISHDALLELVNGAIESEGLSGIIVSADSPEHRPGSSQRLKDWTVKLGGADEATAQKVFTRLENDIEKMAMFPLASKIGGRVSSNMQLDALKALFISLLGVVVYLWVRFSKLTYGIAAAVALVHDVMVTVGMIALSKYVVETVPGLASFLQIDAFQISLTIVAALLTIIGYSINDTIVTFDRLREIKGKSPRLTAKMVNDSVNQCLSRTILTALTVFMTVVILYFFGGDGIHGFAFAFLIGVIAGTYSTVYIAAPVLLWLSGESADIAPATI